MTKSRIHNLEARLEVLSCALRALLAASTPEVREQVAHVLHEGIGAAAHDEASDVVRAGALWQLLQATTPGPPQKTSSR